MINSNFDYKNMIAANLPDEPKTEDEKKLKEVSEEFEAMFIKMMLDTAEKTVNREDSLFYGGNSEDIFRDMLNLELSKSIASKQSMGLAEQFYNQMAKKINKGNE